MQRWKPLTLTRKEAERRSRWNIHAAIGKTHEELVALAEIDPKAVELLKIIEEIVEDDLKFIEET